jgi:hypothetical protein
MGIKVTGAEIDAIMALAGGFAGGGSSAPPEAPPPSKSGLGKPMKKSK